MIFSKYFIGVACRRRLLHYLLKHFDFASLLLVHIQQLLKRRLRQVDGGGETWPASRALSVIKQAAVLNNVPRNGIEPFVNSASGISSPALIRSQPEITGRQQPDVAGILT